MNVKKDFRITSLWDDLRYILYIYICIYIYIYIILECFTENLRKTHLKNNYAVNKEQNLFTQKGGS